MPEASPESSSSQGLSRSFVSAADGVRSSLHGLQAISTADSSGVVALFVSSRAGAPLQALHLDEAGVPRPQGAGAAPPRLVHGHRLREGDQGQRAAQLHSERPGRQGRIALQVQGQAGRRLLLPSRRDARLHQAGVCVQGFLREVQEGGSRGDRHQWRRRRLPQGVREEVQAAVHAAERRGEQGAPGVGRAVGPVRDAAGAADVRAGQEGRGPVHLQQPVPAREAHRRDAQDPAEHMKDAAAASRPVLFPPSQSL